MNILFLLATLFLAYLSKNHNLSVFASSHPFLIFIYISIFSIYYSNQYRKLFHDPLFYITSVLLIIGISIPYKTQTIYGQIHVLIMYTSFLYTFILIYKHCFKLLSINYKKGIQLIELLTTLSTFFLLLYYFQGSITLLFECLLVLFIIAFPYIYRYIN